MRADDSPLTLGEYPRAIAHIDADAFFTSVEQALDPALRARPVVTGSERGIIACASYEAKALGIKRGMPLAAARRTCPELVVLPSDYEAYSLYSRRMFNIMRQYTPIVEEYSIDEAFLDLTGMRRIYRSGYAAICRRIQAEIERELGLTVSVGLSLSKTLAKRCSAFRKPRGFTGVPGLFIHILLRHTPLEKVWGFGPNTVHLLRAHGLQTAHDYVMRPRAWADKLLRKPGRELWSELRGEAVWPVSAAAPRPPASIVKSATFAPPSQDRAIVYAHLAANVEAALLKARRYRLRPAVLGVVLRRQDFRHDAVEARLNRPSAATLEVLPLVRPLFERAFREHTPYRATLVFLGKLENDRVEQADLFEDRLRIDALRRVTGAVDALNRRFGRGAVRAGAALMPPDAPANPRATPPARHAHRAPGESPRRRISLPRMDLRV